MLFEFGILAMFIIIVVVLFVGALLLKGLHYAIAIAINSVIGFFALYAFKAFLMPDLLINVWSVLIVAILGIIGLGIVLVLYGLGLFFVIPPAIPPMVV
jgi:hypothetical protein